jgi:hypothetical protein
MFNLALLLQRNNKHAEAVGLFPFTEPPGGRGALLLAQCAIIFFVGRPLPVHPLHLLGKDEPAPRHLFECFLY